jgi:hypothetical protein
MEGEGHLSPVCRNNRCIAGCGRNPPRVNCGMSNVVQALPSISTGPSGVTATSQPTRLVANKLAAAFANSKHCLKKGTTRQPGLCAFLMDLQLLKMRYRLSA